MENNAKPDALTALILEVFRLNGALLEIGDRMTLPHGLTSARWQVLGAISMEGQPLTVPDIGRRMGLSRQAVQRVVADLERLRFVNLTDNPRHKKAKLVGLSIKGADALQTLDGIQSKWALRIVDGLDNAEIRQMFDLVKLVRERCEESKSHHEPIRKSS